MIKTISRMTPTSRGASAFLPMILGCLMVGCGPSRDPNLPATATVRGQVLYNGQPFTQGTVTFHPSGEGNPGVSRLDAEGRFSLSTYGSDDGAVIGEHVVTIDVPPPLDGEDSSQAATIPAKYANVDTSPLKVTIPEGGDDTLELVIEK